jgi:hypothetical protein
LYELVNLIPLLWFSSGTEFLAFAFFLTVSRPFGFG